MALYGMKDSKAVAAYNASSPGVNISDAQKVERMERRAVRDIYGSRSALSARRTRATVGSMRVPDGSFWCECGLLRGHDSTVGNDSCS